MLTEPKKYIQFLLVFSLNFHLRIFYSPSHLGGIWNSQLMHCEMSQALVVLCSGNQKMPGLEGASKFVPFNQQGHAFRQILFQQFYFLTRSHLLTSNNWDSFEWDDFFTLLSPPLIQTVKIQTREESEVWKANIIPPKKRKKKVVSRKYAHFSKMNNPWDITLTFSPNLLRNGRRCYFHPSRSSDVGTSFYKTGFSQSWAHYLSSVAP